MTGSAKEGMGMFTAMLLRLAYSPSCPHCVLGDFVLFLAFVMRNGCLQHYS
jgi:hypothetical protein